MLERLLLKRIQSHIISSSNFNPFQLAYPRYFSTESAMLLAVDNIYDAIDTGSFTVLVSLDRSAAFDTIEHSILLNRLENSFGNTGLALAWFQSYLSDRRQFVRIGGSKYPEILCCTGVPHGSVLGPMLFSLYISPIAHIVSSFGLLQQ